MFKSILVGLDESEYSKAAVDTGIMIAEKLGCKLFGLGIIDVPTIFDNTPGIAGSICYKDNANHKQYKVAQARVSKCLNDFKDKCEKAKVDFGIHRTEGSPLEELINASIGYDMILFGRKTYFEKEKREGPDSIITSILKRTPRPVIIAPTMGNYSLDKPAVITFDGSIPSSRALQLFTLLSYNDSPSNIHLITVSDDKETGQAHQIRAAKYLERWYGAKPVTEILRKKPTDSQAILDYAADVDARVIVMGAYGIRGLKSIFFGSCTREILKKTKTLLFLYH